MRCQLFSAQQYGHGTLPLLSVWACMGHGTLPLLSGQYTLFTGDDNR